ncbi:hypothetical protein [Microbacterium sp. LWH3-1.2]|uniref:hypothetical protein n=1 Tax=Microbacterium sp. LWH3-1.2 TaxID=3135256 RepID=UPI003412C028
MSAFEVISLIINGALLVATAVATAIAWGKANEARAERGKAEDAANRALAAQEGAADALARSAEAHEALVAEATRRPPWTGPRHVRGEIRAVTNTSGRRVTVSAAPTKPEGTENYLTLMQPLPCTLEPGEEFQYAALTRAFGAPTGMTLVWSFDGDSEENTTYVPF